LRARRIFFRGRGLLRRGAAQQREAYAEGRAAPFARALDGHRPAVQFYQAADDGEADAEPAVLARAGAVGLTEVLEDVRQKVGTDPRAVIGDDDLGLLARALERDFDPTAFGRELDGVRQQVPDHLLQAVWVAGDRADVAPVARDEPDGFRFRRRMHHVHRRRYDGRQFDGLHFEA